MPNADDTVPPRPTRLVLVRHGQALANVEHRIEGVATCRGLTDLGKRQSMAVADRLRAENFSPDVFVCSPIRRAHETAQFIADAIGRPIDHVDADFEEVRPGEAEGMSWDQYFAYYGAVEGWDPAVPFAPGGEAWVDFAARVSRSLDRLAADHHGKTVLVVAHGGVVDSSVFHFFGLDPQVRAPIDFETTNTSITEWELRTFPIYRTPVASAEGTGPADEVAPVRRWRMVRYNDAAHVPLA